MKSASKGPGSGRESAIRALAGHRPGNQRHQGRDARAAQRLPPAQKTPRVTSTLNSSTINSWLVIQVLAFASAAVSACRFSARRNIWNAAITVPGVHGPKSRRKHTDYGLGLIEKQKLRYYYGLLERQFRGVYEKALKRRGVTGEQMLQILETRLDNVVFHLGFANTRAAARQMVSHGHVTVNGRKVNVPSYGLKVNDAVEVKNTNVSRQLATKNLEMATSRAVPDWLSLEQGRVQGHGHADSDARRDPTDCQ